MLRWNRCVHVVAVLYKTLCIGVNIVISSTLRLCRCKCPQIKVQIQTGILIVYVRSPDIQSNYCFFTWHFHLLLIATYFCFAAGAIKKTKNKQKNKHPMLWKFHEILIITWALFNASQQILFAFFTLTPITDCIPNNSKF